MLKLPSGARNALIWLLLLIIFYLVSRLFNLTKLPIFTDEAIYIRWSQIGSRDASWRFISLVDGKQPMYTWAMMVMLRFVADPLLAGRAVSVLAGFASLVAIGFLTYELSKDKKITLLACILYIISPFSLMYDRMALYDSLVASFYLWSLYFSVRLTRDLCLDKALILGMILGAGMLNKTSGFLSLYLLPFILFIFDFQRNKKIQRIIRWVSLIAVAWILSQMIYSVLRLSPLFNMIKQKDSVFVYPIFEWIKHPFLFLEGNLKGLFDWTINYLTIPIFILSLLSIFDVKKLFRVKIMLFIWWFVPLLGLAFFGKVLYPRFVLFMTMPLLVLAAFSLNKIINFSKRNLLGRVLLLLVIFPSVIADYFIITNPLYALIPYADKGQYIDNWPSGWGIKEVNNYLANKATSGKIYVFTEGTFGLLPYGIEIYLVDNPNVSISGIWPLPEVFPEAMIKAAENFPTYFILNQSQQPPVNWPLELINEYQKGNRKDRKLRFYRVLAPPGSLTSLSNRQL